MGTITPLCWAKGCVPAPLEEPRGIVCRFCGTLLGYENPPGFMNRVICTTHFMDDGRVVDVPVNWDPVP